MLHIENINKTFRTRYETIEAVKNVSFDLADGEFVMMLGKSGSGKSTLLNIIGLIDDADSGCYTLDGRDVFAMSRGEKTNLRGDRIGYIFQGFNLINTMTAFENVELPLGYRGMKKAERTKIAADALASVGLEERLHHKPSELSGGEQQRVAIARAAALKPSLILADEPTGNLDRETTEEIMNLLKNISSTVFMVTHDEGLLPYADRVLRLEKGVMRPQEA